jgi:hypothetical protein
MDYPTSSLLLLWPSCIWVDSTSHKIIFAKLPNPVSTRTSLVAQFIISLYAKSVQIIGRRVMLAYRLLHRTTRQKFS